MSRLTADELKAQGNAMFARKDFATAIVKFSKAIALGDPDNRLNAILYANRSACQKGMKRYTEALSDAVKATEIDPSYTKGWGRAGDAYSILKEYGNSIDAFQKAIDSLPQSNLSDAELALKTQYEVTMSRNKAILDKPSTRMPQTATPHNATDTMPWHVASSMIPMLIRKQHQDSSAWSLHAAHIEFKQGVSQMKTIQNVNDSITGHAGVLQNLVEALILNERIFHIDIPNWLDLFNKQMVFEKNFYNPWPASVGPSRIIEEAPKRVAEEGWKPVRMALNMTVRFWIMKAFLAGTITDDHEREVELLRNAVTVLTWGRREWADVHRTNRGAIFDFTFVSSVRRLYLKGILETCAPNAERREEMLALLATEARELIADVSAVRIAVDTDITFVWSFYRNCEGTAHASLGYYYVQKALQTPSESMQYLRKAADHYLQAANGYASDDENHTWYLHCALEYLDAIRAPQSEQLEIVLRLKEALPRMRRIWCPNVTLRKETRERAYAADLKREATLKRRA